MKLYIVQHGLAAGKAENPLRPLTEQGIYDIRRLAVDLRGRGIQPRHIMHSGKERSRQTAELIAAELGIADRVRQVDGIAPNDDASMFAACIKPFTDDVLIASHLPFVQNLCAALLGEGALGDFGFEPGRVVCIGIEESGPVLEWTV